MLENSSISVSSIEMSWLRVTGYWYFNTAVLFCLASIDMQCRDFDVWLSSSMIFRLTEKVKFSNLFSLFEL